MLYLVVRFVTKVSSLIAKVTTIIKDFFNFAYTKTPLGSFFKNIPKSFSGIIAGAKRLGSKALKPIEAIRDALFGFVGILTGQTEFKMPTISGVLDFFDSLKKKVGDARNILGDFFGSLFSSLIGSEKTGKIAKLLGDAFGAIGNVLSPLKNAFGGVGEAVVAFYNKLKGAASIGDAFKKIVESVKERLSGIGKVVTDFLSSSGLDKAVNAVQDFVGKVLTYISGLDPAKVMLAAFTLALIRAIMNIGDAASSANNMFFAFSKFPDALNNTLAAMKKAIMGSTVVQFSIAISSIAGSLALLSKMDQKDLRESAKTLIMVAGAIGIIVGALMLLQKFTGGTALLTTASGFAGLGAAILLLSLSLIALDKVDFNHLLDDIKALGAIVAMMTAVALILGHGGTLSIAGALSLLSFAIAITKVVDALAKISALMNSGAVSEKTINQLIKLMGALAVLGFVAGRVGIGAGIGLLGVMASLLMFRRVLLALAGPSFDYSLIEKNLDKISSVMGMFGALLLMLRLGGKYALGAGIAILAITGALFGMKSILVELSNIEFKSATGYLFAIDTLRSLIVGMSMMLLATHFAGKYAVKAAIAISMLTVSMTLIAGLMFIAANNEKHLAAAERAMHLSELYATSS